MRSDSLIMAFHLVSFLCTYMYGVWGQLDKWQKTLSNLAIRYADNKSSAKYYKNSITVRGNDAQALYFVGANYDLWIALRGDRTSTLRRVKQIPFGILHLLFHAICVCNYRLYPYYIRVLALRTKKISSRIRRVVWKCTLSPIPMSRPLRIAFYVCE